MPETRPSEPQPVSMSLGLLDSAKRFVDEVAAIDKRLRRTGHTIPPAEAKAEVATAFWAFVEVMHGAIGREQQSDQLASCREIVGKWLFRSRLWNRSHQKPHGYPGDYLMIEWMYDLEDSPCADPFQPAIVNCLDELFKTVHSVVSVWERRRWFAGLLRSEYERGDGVLHILDVAAGGARYLCDFLEELPETKGVAITLVDQDAAAVAYCRERSLARWRDQVTFLCAPIRSVSDLLGGQRFDLVLSAGLFDYLDDPAAKALVERLTGALTPRGLVALSNFHPEDPSRYVKEVLVDWSLLFRDEAQCARLFPAGVPVQTSRSRNRALVYAVGGPRAATVPAA